jgi:hypothetical protein
MAWTSDRLAIFVMRRIVDALKRHPAVYDAVRHQLYSRLRSLNRRRIFRVAFQNNLWDGEQSASGLGSSLEATEPLRSELPGVLARPYIKSLLDIPCGEVHWISNMTRGTYRYIGADIVQEVIEKNRKTHSDLGEFVCLDLLTDPLPKADVILCRDCLVHLSLRDGVRAIRNMQKSGAAFLLLTTFPGVTKNTDTVAPYWRPLNMQIEPFNLTTPLELIKDYAPGTKNAPGQFLGMWAVAREQTGF